MPVGFTPPTIGALLLLLVVCGAAFAQTTYGLIEGSIIDASGGALSGATVTVTQSDTGFVRTVVTNELGLYRALNLHPAEYDVNVELRGFAKVTRRSVKVDIGQTVALNLTMEVDKVAVVLRVAPPPALNAVTPEISNTIDTRRVNELPLNGRDFTRLALLAPGVVQTVGLIASIVVNAADYSQNNFLLDGIDATRIDDAYPSNGFERGSRLQTASVESIEEFRVLTSNYSAEYGRAAGAVISAVTKSGTNAPHGSGYGFFRNDRFDARNFFDGHRKPPFDMKQFGGTASAVRFAAIASSSSTATKGRARILAPRRRARYRPPPSAPMSSRQSHRFWRRFRCRRRRRRMRTLASFSTPRTRTSRRTSIRSASTRRCRSATASTRATTFRTRWSTDHSTSCSLPRCPGSSSTCRFARRASPHPTSGSSGRT